MRLTPDYDRAKLEAARVLRQNHVVRPPILPKDLAESSGLTVRYVRFGPKSRNVCGFLEFDENRITVNADESTNRQTFTVAHELGHFVLHRDLYLAQPELYKVLLRHPISRETDPREKEANAFAANLLVPKNLLKLYERFANNKELANLFGVSEEVIGYRRGYSAA